MVFPSLPLYLDPPNWNQPAGGAGDDGAELHQQHPPLPAAQQQRQEGGAVRPGSMADRARLAKLPLPEAALKCPRCDSTNTKFCYFNNYSLSQPRHFCKTCRRYWTRGGALRSVPVGGGCRRNKKSKAGGASKPQSSAAAAGGASTSSSAAVRAIGLSNNPAVPLPFMTSLHQMVDYGQPNIGLSFAGMQPGDAGEYQLGSSSTASLEQWRLQQIQQFPFFGGLETSSSAAPAAPVQGLYAFDGEGGGVDATGFGGQQGNRNASSAGLVTQMASVKMEGSSQGLHLQRPYFAVARNDQYWGGGGGGDDDGGGASGGGWMTDLSAFNSSASGNLL